MSKVLLENLSDLFLRWAEIPLQKIEKMPAHGSDRQYYRIFAKEKTAIGVYNPDLKENIAFLTFSKHFKNTGLNVPDIYSQELDKNIYLEEDLGDVTLFSFLAKNKRYKRIIWSFYSFNYYNWFCCNTSVSKQFSCIKAIHYS